MKNIELSIQRRSFCIKKMIYILSAVCCCLLLSSCTTTESSRNLGEEVLECFDTDDIDGLKELFCSATLARTKDIEEQIQDAFDFYEGKSITYGSITAPEERSIRKGRVVKVNANPFILDIETDEGKKYDIKIYAYTINAEHPDFVGISEINVYIRDENDDLVLEKEIGDLIYY